MNPSLQLVEGVDLFLDGCKCKDGSGNAQWYCMGTPHPLPSHSLSPMRPCLIACTGVSPMTGRPPRVIYIIPSGQNPTGAVMGVERKREIYEVGRSFTWVAFPGHIEPDFGA